MKWTHEYREQVKEKVRSILVRKPNASKYELAKILEIDKDVALRLKKQVIRENTRRISKQEVAKEVGKMEAEYEQLALECWQIITQDVRKVKVKKIEDGKEMEVEMEVLIEAREKLRAIRNIVEIKKTLFNIKFDAGIFSRKLGELKLGKALTQEEQDLIKKAIELNYGKKPKPETKTGEQPKSDKDTTARGNEPKGTGDTSRKNKPE